MRRFVILLGGFALAFGASCADCSSEASVAEFLKRVESGDEPEIMGAAGDLYLEGRGVGVDWHKAQRYYRIALSNGVDEIGSKLQFLDFVLSAPGFCTNDHVKALIEAVNRDRAQAEALSKKSFGIPNVDAVIGELKLALLPHDGFWHGIESAEEWAENIRTNSAMKSSADFRDQEWIPFVCREFIGDKERGESCHPKVRSLIERTMWDCWSSRALSINPKIFAEAKEMADSGCGNVMVWWLAAYALRGDEAARWLTDMEARAGSSHSPELARFLVSVARRNCPQTKKVGFSQSPTRAADWVKSRRFAKGDSRSLYRTLAVLNHSVRKEMADALRGVPSVDEDIIRALEGQTEGVPVFPELGAVIIKEQAGDEDAFSVASRGMFDDFDLNWKFLFYNCSARWRGDNRTLERFGNACYDAMRFDSMLPITYLDSQFFLAVEQDIPFERYFEDRIRFERCMKCCDALMENRNAYKIVRTAARYYKATLTYCNGDLATLKEFFTDEYAYKMMPPTYMIHTAESYGGMIGAMAALSGKDADRLVPLHRQYREGKFSEFRDGAKVLEKDGGLSRESLDYLHMYSKQAMLKSPDCKGEWIAADLVNSRAEFFTRFPEWHCDEKGQGWFVGARSPSVVPLKWNMPLGASFEVDVGLNPLIDGSYSKAVIQCWVAHYKKQPLPEVVCEFKDGKVRVNLCESGDADDRWYGTPVECKYTGGIFHVRVQYQDGRVSVWLGDGVSANLTTDRFKDSFAKIRERDCSSVICAKGLCVRSWKARKIK